MSDEGNQIENIDETERERRKFNLIPGEDLMQIHRPSLFAFAGMYVMALLIGAVHYIWTFMPSEAPGQDSWYNSRYTMEFCIKFLRRIRWIPNYNVSSCMV